MPRSAASQYQIFRGAVGFALTAAVSVLFWFVWRTGPVLKQTLWPTKFGCGCETIAIAYPPITIITASLVWLAISIVLFRFAFYFIRQIRASRQALSFWTRAGSRTVYHQTIKSNINILNQPGCQAMTIGLFQPRVYITDDLIKSLTGTEVTAVLRHELAHLQRFDQLWSAVLDCWSLALWRLPLLQGWVVANLTLREISADSLATKNYQQTDGLSGAILKLSRFEPIPGLVGFSPNQDRVEKLINHDWYPKITWWRGSYTLILGLAMIGLTAVIKLTPPVVAAIPPAVATACHETKLLCRNHEQPLTANFFSCAFGSGNVCVHFRSPSQSLYVFPVSAD